MARQASKTAGGVHAVASAQDGRSERDVGWRAACGAADTDNARAATTQARALCDIARPTATHLRATRFVSLSPPTLCAADAATALPLTCCGGGSSSSSRARQQRRNLHRPAAAPQSLTPKDKHGAQAAQAHAPCSPWRPEVTRTAVQLAWTGPGMRALWRWRCCHCLLGGRPRP